MTSSRYSDRVRTWGQIEGDFLQSCRILFLPWKGGHESKGTATCYHTGMNKAWGAGEVVSVCPPDSGFLLKMERRTFCLYGFGLLFVFWFYTIEFCCNAVGFCDLPLVGCGTEMFTWGLFCVVNLGSFLWIFCDLLFHTNAFRSFLFYFILFFISTIYRMANFISFKSIPKLVFSDTSVEKEISASCEAGRYF